MVYLLRNGIRDYAWGSTTAIAELLGKPASGGPEAELWMGAHPIAPSEIQKDGGWQKLDQFIAQDSERVLGPNVAGRFGPRLPFLLKVLAADRPLSLQAHPSQAQAEAGFSAEQAAGIPLSAPHRNYKDPNHKPELICALTPFYALCGFRKIETSLSLFDSLAVRGLDAYVDRLRKSPTEQGLRSLVSALLRADPETQRALAEATRVACAGASASANPFASELGWAARIGELYEGDVGIVTALLLNLLRLEPGQAVYLPAGNLHAYLSGIGIEIMASSDNVLRGGLTPKHVDVPELLEILDFRSGEVTPLLPEPTRSGEFVYTTPAPEFRLSRIDLAPDRPVELEDRTGPEILLAVSGEARAETDEAALSLSKGQSIFVPASATRLGLSGMARVYRARVNDI